MAKRGFLVRNTVPEPRHGRGPTRDSMGGRAEERTCSPPAEHAQVQERHNECWFYSTSNAAFELDLLVSVWFKTHTSV